MNPAMEKGQRVRALQCDNEQYVGQEGTLVGDCIGHKLVRFADATLQCVRRWELVDPPAEPYVPAEGDRVRVTFEGVADGTKAGRSCWIDGGTSYGFVLPEHIERLPDPEPEWQPGDVVRSKGGYTYFRTDRGVWVGHMGDRFDEDAVTQSGPLTLLVRDGKPVGGAS